MKKFAQIMAAMALVIGLVAENAHAADVVCRAKSGILKVAARRCPAGTKPFPMQAAGKGEKGDKGDRGADGAQGIQGEVGPQGPQGEKGDIGPIGPEGPQGPKGEDGAVGPKGDKGEKGDDGASGSQGPKGDKGDVGAAGAQGPQGERGLRGDVGPKGEAGTAVNFTNDILMTCKQFSFKSNLKTAGSTTDKFGRTARKVTARCGANQWLAGHSEALLSATPDSQVVATLVTRDIVTNPMSNTNDSATGPDASSAVPSGVIIEFFDSLATNLLTTRLVCCTLDVNAPEGKPTIE